jgi:hypothetical protein
MKIGDLVKWKKFENDSDVDSSYNDVGVITSIDIFELSKDQVIVGVQFSKIGFVWCNPKSLEVINPK